MDSEDTGAKTAALPLEAFRSVCVPAGAGTSGLPSSSPAIVVSFSHLPATLHAQAVLAAFLSRRHETRIQGFDFTGHTTHLVDPVLETWGCPPMLRLSDCSPTEPRDREQLAEWHARGLSKRQVLDLHFDDLPVGPLLYNSYCRYYVTETVDLSDERFWKVVRQALCIYRRMTRYFDENEVLFAIVDHPCYLRNGIVARIAALREIPVLVIGGSINLRRFAGDTDPAGWHTNHSSLPWRLYHRLFDGMDSEDQDSAREWARGMLEGHLGLNGQPGRGPWCEDPPAGTANPASVFRDSGKPRMLVMPPDFCDEVHRYGRLLHCDFREWIEHLLSIAQETDFDWYVKMHPENPAQVERCALNARVFDDLQRAFPQVTFLPSTVSNRRILAEGIHTLFSVRGSPVYEFAYQGVPVVTGGDSMHMSFDYSLQPKSLDEFEEMIRRADQLNPAIDRRQVEEFYYVNHRYFEAAWREDVASHDSLAFLNTREFHFAKRKSEFFRIFADLLHSECLGIIHQAFEKFFDSPAWHYGSAATPPSLAPRASPSSS